MWFSLYKNEKLYVYVLKYYILLNLKYYPPSSFPSREKNANMAGHPPLTVQEDWRVVWWKDLGSVSWDNTAAGPDGPEGLSQTTLDPNISNMKDH